MPAQDVASARAAEQAAAKARRAERRAADARRPAAPLEGRAWIGLDVVGTAVFVLTGALGAIAYQPLKSSWEAWPATVVSLVLFAGGCALFLLALFEGARRSRRSVFGVGGWFFLSGAADRRTSWLLNGALGVQVVVGIAVAAARPFTALAFATLVPVFGLAVNGIWGARYGTFPDRPEEG